MRGKLRDKHARSKHDVFKHETIDKKRPSKQNIRMEIWLNPDLDEQDNELFEEEEAGQEERIPVQQVHATVQKQQPKKN
jgi:hypothetical protein